MSKPAFDLIAQALETIVAGVALDPSEKAIVAVAIHAVRDHAKRDDATKDATPKTPAKPKAPKSEA